MNFERMRGLLLDQAIHGRLVSQEVDDGVVKQIGIAPDAEPFTLPKSWRWINLKELVTPTKQTIPVENFTYIDVSSIKNFQLEGAKQLEPSNAPSRARKVVQAGMVLFATVRPYLKNICIAPKLSRNVIASTAFATMSCSDYLNNRYLFYVLRSDYFTELVKGKQRGISYPAISEKDFYACHIPVPPVKEQIRIVAKLEEAFAEIDRAEKAYQELQTLSGVLRGQILQEAIQGKLVPQLDCEEEVEQIGDAPEDVPFAIPEKWKWKTLKSITGTITDGTHHSPKNSQVKDEVFKNLYVTAKNIKYTGVDLCKPTYVDDEVHAEIVKRCSPAFGDVLFVKDGATTGVVTVNDLHDSFSMLSSVALIKTLPEVLDSQYLVYVLRSPVIEKVIRSKMKGTGIPRVTLKILQSIPIPVPPFVEQLRIVEKVHDLLKQVDALSGK